jgi:hypothetical protein
MSKSVISVRQELEMAEAKVAEQKATIERLTKALNCLKSRIFYRNMDTTGYLTSIIEAALSNPEKEQK